MDQPRAVIRLRKCLFEEKEGEEGGAGRGEGTIMIRIRVQSSFLHYHATHSHYTHSITLHFITLHHALSLSLLSLHLLVFFHPSLSSLFPLFLLSSLSSYRGKLPFEVRPNKGQPGMLGEEERRPEPIPLLPHAHRHRCHICCQRCRHICCQRCRRRACGSGGHTASHTASFNDAGQLTVDGEGGTVPSHEGGDATHR